MNYKPDESQLMAYLYGELQGEYKQRMEQYLAEHPEVRRQLDEMNFVRESMRHAKDKEVIVPPIVFDNQRTVSFWQNNYMRAITGIAASLALLIVVAKLTGLTVQAGQGMMTIGFSDNSMVPVTQRYTDTGLTPDEVQQMIDAAMQKNNIELQAGWQDSQQLLNESIRNNLAAWSDARVRSLMQQVSHASQDQIRDFALTLQAENAKMIRDYLALNANDQRAYMEELLVDFAQYLQQQHRNDLQALQARLNYIEEDNDVFRYETGQILASIINTVEPVSTDIKN